MKLQCPFCHQNLKASPDPPLINNMYDLCCPPHTRIRFSKEHIPIEYNLYTDTHAVGATSNNYCYTSSFLEKAETTLYKLTNDSLWPKIINLPFFMSFKTQAELDAIMLRLLKLKAFS